ncbi:type VII secretion target [Nocardia amamiensis]|uniref:type VII secretion target n=1 Tax=Nocardia amamiensis TaxID=404578 RepID=UPI000830040D|nr:type VII secretion target [Nocardia amamiensis]
MSDYLDIELEQLPVIAKQHDLVAANIRKWGEIPHAWLADFQSTYGMIAEPVRAALVDYYEQRHAKAERLAADHERTRDQLIAAARALEDADQTGRSQITQSGGFDVEGRRVGPAPGAPTDLATSMSAGPGTPTMNGARPGQPSITTPEVPGVPGRTGRFDQDRLPSAASAPRTNETAPAAATAPTGTMPPTVGRSEPDAADIPTTMVGDANSAPGMSVNASGAAGTADRMPAPPATTPFAAMVGVDGAGTADWAPAPLAAGPFAAVAHAAEGRRVLPSLVVGQRVDEDLALARTLLAAILAAVAGSASGLEWAVAVVRTSAGPIVVLTSSEGRGWLPTGLFLPSEVILPWRWDSVLGTAGREAVAGLEGISDPARILAEFGSLVGSRGSVRISALVSSAAIGDDLRATLGDDVALEGRVSAAEAAIDLTSPGVGLVDRLALAGSKELLRQAAVPDTEIRATCLELARAADTLVRAAASSTAGQISTRRTRRQQILDALDAGQTIPASWWNQLRAADDMTAAALRARRVDVSHLLVSAHLDVRGTKALRGMVFERRADELLLLLAAGEPDRQTLRDVLYTYGQIVEHPLFPAAAHAVVAPAPKMTATGTAVPDVEVAGSVWPDARGVSAVSARAIGLSGGPHPSPKC